MDDSFRTLLGLSALSIIREGALFFTAGMQRSPRRVQSAGDVGAASAYCGVSLRIALPSPASASLLHCNKKLRNTKSNVSDPIGSGFIASQRGAEQFFLRFCFPVARQLSEGSVITRRRNVRRNPAEDVIELSDRPLEILIAGKHECVLANRA